MVSAWTPQSHHWTKKHTTGLKRSRSLGKQEHSSRRHPAKVSMRQDMDLLAVGPRNNLHSKEVFMMIFTFKDPGSPVASQISKVPFFFLCISNICRSRCLLQLVQVVISPEKGSEANFLLVMVMTDINMVFRAHIRGLQPLYAMSKFWVGLHLESQRSNQKGFGQIKFTLRHFSEETSVNTFLQMCGR